MKYYLVNAIATLELISCKASKSKLAGTESSEQNGVQLEMENQDINLPSEIQQLFSLVYGSPVYDDGNKVRTTLRHDPEHGLDIIAGAIRALPPELKDVVNIEDGGSDSMPQSAGESINTSLKFRGVCLNGTAFLLAGQETLNAYTFEPASGRPGVDLQNVAKMPTTYRQDLTSCKSRVQELIRIKYREPQEVENQLAVLESLNFAFAFMPGYAGTENISNGNFILGTVEILADIATLGAATKFKAGWQTLNLSKRMYRSVQSGFRMATIGSNTVRLGTLIGEVNRRGLSVMDIPMAVLLVTETGFVLNKIRVRSVKLNAVKSMQQGLDKIPESQLSAALSKLGLRLSKLAPGSLTAIFKSKYVGEITADELNRIRAAINKGDDIGIDDLHKLISGTGLKSPDTLINVTSDKTIMQVLDSGGTYWGYVGFPGLPRGMYATPKPISWSSFDLANTAGSTMTRDTMFVFTADAAKDFQKIKLQSNSFFGSSIVTQKDNSKTI